MKKRFVNSYRIIEDFNNGFEAQVKVWWLPFWFQMIEKGCGCNTHLTLNEAIDFIKKNKIKLKILAIETQERLAVWEYQGRKSKIKI